MGKTQSHERPYHHGDLRRAIVKAALEILRETQSLEFSLRDLARRAGVSHNSSRQTDTYRKDRAKRGTAVIRLNSSADRASDELAYHLK